MKYATMILLIYAFNLSGFKPIPKEHEQIFLCYAWPECQPLCQELHAHQLSSNRNKKIILPMIITTMILTTALYYFYTKDEERATNEESNDQSNQRSNFKLS